MMEPGDARLHRSAGPGRDRGPVTMPSSPSSAATPCQASRHLGDGPLEACGLIPRSRLRGIRVGFFSDHVGHQVVAVNGQTLERLTLIAGGQRVGSDAVVPDSGKALLKIGA